METSIRRKPMAEAFKKENVRVELALRPQMLDGHFVIYIVCRIDHDSYGPVTVSTQVELRSLS
jgi:hypothetical protein